MASFDDEQADRGDGWKICPECGYVFQRGAGDDFDRHWRAQHEGGMRVKCRRPCADQGDTR